MFEYFDSHSDVASGVFYLLLLGDGAMEVIFRALYRSIRHTECQLKMIAI